MKYKERICILFMILAMVFCETSLFSSSTNEFAKNIKQLSAAIPVQSIEAPINPVLEEYCTSELIGVHVLDSIVTSRLLVKSQTKTRSSYGRLFIFILIVLFLFQIFTKLLLKYLLWPDTKSVAVILNFIHKKDGKK